MKRSRFSDEQIIGILKEHQAGMSAADLCRSYRHARNIIEEWRIDYNLHRPHTSLDGLTPNEFATRSTMDQNLNRANL